MGLIPVLQFYHEHTQLSHFSNLVAMKYKTKGKKQIKTLYTYRNIILAKYYLGCKLKIYFCIFIYVCFVYAGSKLKLLPV